MITKEKIAQRIIQKNSGGLVSSNRKVDPREIYEGIETVRNAMMEKFIQENGHLDGEFITQYKNIDVLCDDSTMQFYSILPARLISFSTFDGLHQVSPMKSQSRSFVKVSNGFQSTYNKLEASKLAGNTGYYIERVKIGTDRSIRVYYQNIPEHYKKVLIKMVASTYDFDEDEALPIPASSEEPLVLAVDQWFMQQYQIPQDVKNNSEPQQ